MKICIAIPHDHLKEQLENAKSFVDDVVFYDKIENLPTDNTNFFVLNKGDIILKWPSLQPSKYVCVTNGIWVDKQKRFTNKIDTFNPIFLKNKFFKFPDFKNNKLQNLYDTKNYSDFALESEKFLYDHIRDANIILRYFLGIVYFFKIKNSKKAHDHLTYIIQHAPYFAEAWCLIGDIFAYSNMYFESKKQYENALAYGKTRDIYDDLPMCPKKYEEYPSEMIAKINDSLQDAKVLTLDNI